MKKCDRTVVANFVHIVQGLNLTFKNSGFNRPFLIHSNENIIFFYLISFSLTTLIWRNFYVAVKIVDDNKVVVKNHTKSIFTNFVKKRDRTVFANFIHIVQGLDLTLK